ncbi:MAG TPA: hypothetical protein VE869_13435 [Gemmatimonas sp.]|nr:hypothetical protein [Gemmatimonas sp.]
MTGRLCLVAAAALNVVCFATVRAQTPAPSVSVGFGVDTAGADVADIVRLVRAYLAKPDTSARSRGLWDANDALGTRAGDLAASFAYQGFPATVAGVVSAGAGDSVYVVKLLHARASTGGAVMPLAMQRLYAVRTAGSPHGWQLSNALPRLTAAWPTLTVGRVMYHYAPGQRPDSARATRAPRFIDSVSTMFGVQPPARIDYYVTGSTDEYHRALGLDFFVLSSGRGSATGGNAILAADIVLAGDPAQGEAYLHEVAHLVVRDRFGGGSMLGEGIPTWLAGSKGRDAQSLFRLLAAYQRSHPRTTLAALIRGDVQTGWTNAEVEALYASSALFVEAVHSRNGVQGLRALAGTPREPAALMVAMQRALGIGTAPDALESWWRRAAIELQR